MMYGLARAGDDLRGQSTDFDHDLVNCGHLVS